jgi:hypothetical protein
MTPKHRALRTQYVKELRESKEVAEKWWSALVGDESSPAAQEAKARWPDGPASHPRVIGTILKYMHKCEALNHTVDEDDTVYLNEFLIDRLDGEDSQDLLKFTNALTYWPLALDKDRKPI